MTALSDHRDLDVWQEAIVLAQIVYALSADFPDNEKYGLTSQVRRSAVSVPANIAEGAGRTGTRELLRFIGIARGSLAETDTHLTLAQRLGLVGEEEVRPVQEHAARVARMLTRLKQSLSKQNR